ncbi:hypothetical protein [Beijerinckia sp. L45]|uniref:hypothetical protein n=1 Tax=Beijerinckia sp. L45 TaxID=1641855 RepID=UPI001AED996A
MALELREAVSSRLLVLFAFGLIALLYLATEELLVEAHEKPDSLLITSCFFVSFWLC